MLTLRAKGIATAHDYERVDGQKICSEILGMLPEVRTYLGYIRAAMNL